MTNPAPADDITPPAMPTPDLGGEITITAATAMDALRAALKSDPEYAWSWHCAIWAGAHDEGLETGAANRAAARVMHMAFGIDTSKHKNFQPSHHATVPAAVDVGAAQAETAQAAPVVPDSP